MRLSEPEVRKRVLVADDDAAVCALLARILGPLASVTVVADGEAALAAIRTEHFDAIVSDYALPGIDGLDLVRLLRAEQSLATIPILMISGHGRELLGARALEAGVDAFLAKPFRVQQVRAVLAELLERT